jgi:hypothetical protein
MTDPYGQPPEVTNSWTPPPYAYGYPYQYQPQPVRKNNGMAVAAMVVSIVGLASMCGWGPFSLFISPVGAVLGHVAKRKIKQTGDAGEGMALTGIILGWIGTALSALILAGFILLFIYGDQIFPDSSYE